jgi:hypothetical protein
MPWTCTFLGTKINRRTPVSGEPPRCLPRPDIGVGGKDAATAGVKMPVPDQLGPAGSREVGPASSRPAHPRLAARGLDSDADPVGVRHNDPIAGDVADERASEFAPVPLRLDFTRDRGTRRRRDFDGPVVVAHRLLPVVVIRRPGQPQPLRPAGRPRQAPTRRPGRRRCLAGKNGSTRFGHRARFTCPTWYMSGLIGAGGRSKPRPSSRMTPEPYSAI